MRSQPPSGRRLPSTQGSKAPPAKSVHYTETAPSSSYENYGTDGESFEFKSKEKEVYKDEVKVSVTDGSSNHHHHHQEPSHADDHCNKEKHHNHKETHHKSGGWSSAAIAVILFIIFIIILFIALGGFWWCQPECVTLDCEDGSNKEFSLLTAVLYAFIIAFLFVIVIGAAWYCCM